MEGRYFMTTAQDLRCRVHPVLGNPPAESPYQKAVSEAARAVSSPRSRRLRARARQLRRDADVRLAPLADALRRRAAELELQAHVLDNTLVPIPVKSR